MTNKLNCNCIHIVENALAKDNRQLVGVRLIEIAKEGQIHESHLSCKTRKVDKSIKQETPNIAFNYCPWCGKSFKA
jgi:predicted  nucleic acid-binding Zn ribbon protein